jgi:hypothetical protein
MAGSRRHGSSRFRTRRMRFPAGMRAKVSGTPQWLLNEPTGACVGPSAESAVRSISLVLVLPTEPVTAITGPAMRARAAAPILSRAASGSSGTISSGPRSGATRPCVDKRQTRRQIDAQRRRNRVHRSGRRGWRQRPPPAPRCGCRWKSGNLVRRIARKFPAGRARQFPACPECAQAALRASLNAWRASS